MFSPHTVASFHPNGAIKLYNCRRDDISRWNKKSYYFLKIVTKLNNFVAYFLTSIILDVKHEKKVKSTMFSALSSLKVLNINEKKILQILYI